MELSAVVDVSPASQQYAAELKTRHFADLGKCLRELTLDGLIIATPTNSHVPNGLAAVEARLPMLVEKPISYDLPSAMQLVEAAEAAEVPILVGHHHRHSPFIKEARRIVKSGRLGKILVVSGYTLFRKPDNYFEGPNTWRRELGGGVMLINLVHAIDDLRNIVGDVVKVQAAQSHSARHFPVEDTGAMLLHFAEGALGMFAISDSVASPWSWEMTSGENPAFPRTNEFCYLVAGTQGSLTVPSLDLWSHRGDGWLTPIAAEQQIVQEEDPLKLELRHFGQVIRREAYPLLDGRDGARTLETTLAVKKAAETGETVFLS